MQSKKSLKVNFLLTFLLSLLLFPSLNYAQQYTQERFSDALADSTTDKPVQYRRGIELNENYQSFDEKYAGKNLQEEKRRFFPLRSTGVWTELNPKVPRVDYLGIQFVNKDTGWAVGNLGTLIKSTDGGNIWTVSETNTTTPILKVRSYNGQVVIASGFGGLILRSTDGGETFTQVNSNVSGDLWGLQMLNDTLGWACGTANSLTKTTDGGLTWQRIFTPGYTSDYWWIDFMPAPLGNESYGFIAANGKVLRTTDGGQNWEIIQAGDSYPLFSIDIIDSLHIAAAGYGGTGYAAKNIYSSDGGNTWINGQQTTTHEINCIKYINTDTGYIAMSEIGMYKTTNRGQNWQSIAGIAGIGEYEFVLLSENTGYAAGTNLKIFKTENGYENWQRLIINDNFADVFFTNETTGYVASRTVYKTLDSGTIWFRLHNFPTNVFTSALNSITFTDSLTGFAGGPPCRIVKTTDAGNTWFVANRTGLADTIGTINKIFFINSATGWAVTSRGGILKTTDGGDNWFAQLNAPLSIVFSSVHFVDSLYGWTPALGARPYKTTDGGQNWIQQMNINIGQSRDVFFMDYQNGFLLESNKLYRTTDGGITWIQNQNLTGFSIAKLSTYKDSTIFIIGYKTYRSIDGGENWFEYTELNGVRIKGMSLLNSGLGYAVGELGLIMKYYDSTYVPVELISFQSESINNKVILSWRTASEVNNKGFEIERALSKTTPLQEDWRKIGFVNGHGTTTEIQFYSFTDESLSSGKYQYRLKQIDYDGSFEYSKVVEVIIQVPAEFSLFQNYPNPFNNSTIIAYQIPKDEFVTLRIYDVLGNEVKTLLQENKNAGYYSVLLNATNLSSGIYFYELKAEVYSSTKKFLLIK
jgi:photosystem II stability/assembly factor-like uncharacterized protein